MTRDMEGKFSAEEPTLEEAKRERRTPMGTKILSTITAIFLTATFAASARAQVTLENPIVPLSNTGRSIGLQSPEFAQELFGPNSGSIKLTIPASIVSVQFGTTSQTSNTLLRVDSGQSAVFTYQLSGARLAQDISAGDFWFGPDVNSANAAAGFAFSAGRDGGGGQKGDDFVSYTVTSTAAEGSATDISGQFFNFSVPDLDTVTVADEKEAADRQVTITVTITPPAQSRFATGRNNFPRYPGSAAAAANQNVTAVARINPAYQLTVDPSATSTGEHTGEIDLNNPSMLTATTTATLVQIGGLGDSSGSSMRGIRISSVTFAATTGDQKAADGVTDFSAGTTDRLRISASGNFAASDRLLFTTKTGNNITYNQSNDFLLTISSDGTSAETARPLSGTGAISPNTAYTLYYVPGGGEIGRGNVGSRYTLDFSAATARDSVMAGKDLTLEYSGISFTNYAYAVPGPNAIDVANLRIRCEGASDCIVFFRCTDQAGMNVGGFERTTVEPESVKRYSSMDLATMLGVEDWNGRLSCSIHSSSRVSVQLLIRSGGTLTNNTFIGGLDASQ